VSCGLAVVLASLAEVIRVRVDDDGSAYDGLRAAELDEPQAVHGVVLRHALLGHHVAHIAHVTLRLLQCAVSLVERIVVSARGHAALAQVAELSERQRETGSVCERWHSWRMPSSSSAMLSVCLTVSVRPRGCGSRAVRP
jgi:hypothetical protein